MADLKIVIGNPKSGKSFQQTLQGDAGKVFLGKKIGEVVKGETLDYTGYEFQITGGSDVSGFPMRKDIPGDMKKKILAVQGVGVKKKRSKTKKGYMTFKGIRQRKTVAGNTVGTKTSQINLKVTKEGPAKIGPEAEAEAKAAEEAKVKKETEAAQKEVKGEESKVAEEKTE